MKPFVHNQNTSGSRWVWGIAVLAAGFGVWYFELIPQMAEVPSGELVQEPAAPELPADWDEIVDRSGDLPDSESDQTDVVFDTLSDEIDPLDRAFDDLAEPQIPSPSSTVMAPQPAQQASNQVVQQVAFAERPPGEPAARGVVRADATSEPSLVLTAESAEQLRLADQLLGQARVVEAHHVLSSVYWKQPEARAVLLQRIESTSADVFADPHRHVEPAYVVQPGDTLESIGRKYEIPWQYLSRLNRVEPKALQAGQELKVLRGPFGAVVDLSRFELTVEAHGYFVRRYEIGIGQDGGTPVGTFTVQEKIENPVWYNPDGGQVDRDDPQNPLGEYWIGLGDHIGIHGTIDPDSIGAARSRGCIHMRDAEVAEVFGFLGEGSVVRIRR